MTRLLRFFRGRGVLSWTVSAFVLVVVGLDLVFPYFAQLLVGGPNRLPVPRTIRLWYLILTAGALAIYVISSDATLDEFVAPLRRAAAPHAGRAERIAFRSLLVAFPLAVGAAVFLRFVPRAEVPSGVRQQHPGMASANAAPYAGKQNPLHDPTPAMLAAFRERHAALPGPEDEFDSRPTKAAFTKETFVPENIVLGRALYFKNCAPCHGPKLDGDGPASRAWSLRPIDFHDPGTIATLVEDAVVWRVSEGGVGLPPVATPWDSAMPRWKTDLSEEDIWKIILAEYHDAGVKPRVLEFRLEGRAK